MPTALLIYSSLTGNTKQAVDIVAKALTDLGVDLTLEESYAADVSAFKSYDICLIATYTWGPDGNLPDEMLDVYDELLELDLSHHIFGVFGSGDTFYADKFGQSVKDFEQAFAHTQAQAGANAVIVDLLPDADDTAHLQTFATDIVQTFKKQS